MFGICYKNTKTTLPGWVNNLHEQQPLGSAYETQTHFVHFYGKEQGLFVISPGLTVIERKDGLLEDWVKRIFGAVDIKPIQTEVGHTRSGVWRPGLYYQEEI